MNRTVYVAGLRPDSLDTILVDILDYEVFMRDGRLRRAHGPDFGPLASYRESISGDLTVPVLVSAAGHPPTFACFDRQSAIDAAVDAS